MSHHSRWRPALVALAATLLVLLPATAWAQAVGRVTGTVVGDGGAPLADAQVSVVGTRLGATTRADGRFELANVPSGARQLRVLRLGYAPQTAAVEVPAGGTATATVTMAATATRLGGVVVSASRRVEKIIDAPATVSRIDAAEIENSVGNSFSGALKNVKGIDYIQTGMTTAAINARGFNSSFNNRMLMIEDGRIAVLPENGLPVGTMTAIPKVDLAGIEVLVGPGAALYGADASNGVLTLMTKDPRQYQGTTVEVAGGNRSYRDFQLRHAGVTGNWGYKVTGEYQGAKDWDNKIAVDGAVQPDFDSSVLRGTGALVYYRGDGRLEGSAGVSQTDAVGQTNVGRNQLIDWVYNFQQLKWVSPRFYANAYRTQSLSGDSYAINRYASARPALPATISDDSVRRLSDWPADGRMYAAEAQANFDVPALLGTRLVVGGQWRNDVVSSDRQWLTDRITGEDLSIQQVGGYAQTETPVLPMLNVVLAARYDKHDYYDAQFSPKAGLVIKPSEDQAFRVTYNRAFKSPTTLQTSFNITDFVPGIGVFGNREGFTIRNAAGDVVGTVDPIVPEENETWEVGYKGVLWNRLFLDAAAYRSDYDNFLTPLIAINVPALGTYAYMGDDTDRLQSPTGTPQTVLTYRNLGRARLNGVDAGARYRLTDRFGLSGTVSVMKADTIEVPSAAWLSAANRRELSVLNAPTTKWTVGADATDLVPGLLGGITMRHVNEYAFASGVNLGVIPSFSTVDLSLGYRLPFVQQTQVNLQVTNLFSCRNTVTTQPAVPASGTTPATPANPLQVVEREGKCGFGEKHTEMINMPQVGTMVFLGVRYQR
jgi:iron complex outermembrane receptor protein